MENYSPVCYGNNTFLSQDLYSKADFNVWVGQKKMMSQIYLLRKNVTQQNFYEVLLKFLNMSEGCSLKAYKDPHGHYHIGHGLLLKLKDVEQYQLLSRMAFESIGINLATFNVNEIKISKDQADKLLLFVVKQQIFELNNKIKFFATLPLNMQISIISLYYNSPVFIGPKFLHSLNEYNKTKQESSLIGCVHEIVVGSNEGAPYYGAKEQNSCWKGIQYRREREMLMFSNEILDKIIFLSPIVFNNA